MNKKRIIVFSRQSINSDKEDITTLTNINKYYEDINNIWYNELK